MLFSVIALLYQQANANFGIIYFLKSFKNIYTTLQSLLSMGHLGNRKRFKINDGIDINKLDILRISCAVYTGQLMLYDVRKNEFYTKTNNLLGN